MRFVRFELENFPFVSSSMLLLLSWHMILFSTVCPCASMKYFDQIAWGNASSAPTSSPSVELRTFTFCFVEVLVVAPFPKVMTVPVCPLQSGCTVYEASTYHLMVDRSSTFRVNFKYNVPRRYCSTLRSFSQLSSSGFLTQVVRNATGS